MKTKIPKIDWRIVVTALVCITVLEIYALSQGINGVQLAIVIGAICTVAGIAIPRPKLFRRD